MKQNAEQAVLDIVEFNNMMDIMKELTEILGINDDDLKNIFEKGTVKASCNGKPIIDIENGVDKLAPKDESKKVHKKEPNAPTTTSGSCPSSTISGPCTCGTQSVCSDSPVSYNNVWLNRSLLKVSPNEFIIVNEVAGRSLADSQTEIVFAHNTEEGWIPGITDKQLLAILCERFKRNPKKVEILRALMNS